MPYSLHNNFEELQSFVAHLRPRAIAPIVTKTYDSRYPIDPNLHFKHLLQDPKQTAELSAAMGRRAVQTAPEGCSKGLMGAGRGGTKRAAKSLGGSAGQENTAQHGRWQVRGQHDTSQRFIACHSKTQHGNWQVKGQHVTAKHSIAKHTLYFCNYAYMHSTLIQKQKTCMSSTLHLDL